MHLYNLMYKLFFSNNDQAQDKYMLTQKVPLNLILLIASIGAISPFAVDTYLSSMPLIAQSFQTDISNISITVSIYVLGMSIGQLIGGRISDNIGRLPVICFGLSVFTIASLMIMISGSLGAFILWRVLQSLGSGMASICATAIVRDNAQGQESAKLFSLIALITMLAPAIAPTVGTIIISFAPWEAIFAFLALLGILVLVFALKILKFEKPKPTSNNKGKTTAFDIFSNKRSLLLLTVQSFAFCVIMIFLANSSFAYQQYFKCSAETFTLLVVANVIGVMIINRISSFMLNRYTADKILVFFLILQFISASNLLYAVFFAPHNLTLVAISLITIMSFGGGIGPNSTALFMRDYAHCAGFAASILFSLQSIVAAAVSAFVAKTLSTSLIPLGIAFFTVVTIALFCAIIIGKTEKNFKDQQINP